MAIQCSISCYAMFNLTCQLAIMAIQYSISCNSMSILFVKWPYIEYWIAISILHCQLTSKIEHWTARDWTLNSHLHIAFPFELWHQKPMAICHSVIQSITLNIILEIVKWLFKFDSQIEYWIAICNLHCHLTNKIEYWIAREWTLNWHLHIAFPFELWHQKRMAICHAVMQSDILLFNQSSLSNACLVLSNASLVLSNACLVLSNASLVLSNARLVLSNARLVLSNARRLPFDNCQMLDVCHLTSHVCNLTRQAHLTRQEHLTNPGS